jgi:hypothetical protein
LNNNTVELNLNDSKNLGNRNFIELNGNIIFFQCFKCNYIVNKNLLENSTKNNSNSNLTTKTIRMIKKDFNSINYKNCVCFKCNSTLRPYINLSLNSQMQKVIIEGSISNLKSEEIENLDSEFLYQNISDKLNQQLFSFLAKNKSVGILEIGLTENDYPLQSFSENLYLSSCSPKYKLNLVTNTSDESKSNCIVNTYIRINPKKESFVIPMIKHHLNTKNKKTLDYFDDDKFDIDEYLIDLSKSQLSNISREMNIPMLDPSSLKYRRLVDSFVKLRKFELEEIRNCGGYFNHFLLPIKETINDMKNILL